MKGGLRFAEAFPEGVPELDALVAAFAEGDYRRVREEAPKLAAKSDDEAVRRAAEVLVQRTRPEPAIVWLVGLTAALLVFLSLWWIVHAHAPPQPSSPPANAAPPVERVR
jgi:hypothetical protein